MTEQHPYKPPGPVQSILAEHVLQQELPEPHFRNLHALPKKFSVSKSSKHGEGRIRVNKEVLAVLKQVSTELDAAQRHYLAYKQYGDAAESLLKLSPDIITLPCEGLAATASQTDVAAGDTSGDAEQHTHAASDARSSGDSSSSHGAAASKDILAGRRRWGYFPLLHRLRATSAKQRRPTQVPALPLEAQARRSADDIPAAVADMSAGDADVAPDSPKGNWMALMKQKKAEKEQGVARMIRIKHAVLVIQRAWRACLQKRASRALAMMVLRAKVRRAHRAAYVSNLLRKKPRGAGQAAAASIGLGDDDGGDDVIVVDEDGEVVLTQQQEAEFELQLQKALEATQAGKATALPPELAHLAELLPDAASSNGSSATLAAMTGSAVQGTESDSEESDEQDEEEEAPVWKVISAPKAAPKRPLLRVETQIPGGPNWAGSLRTPGPMSSHHPSANTPHRIGSPDSPTSSSRHGMHSGTSFKHSPRDRPRSHKAPRPGTSGTSRPASRAHGRLSTFAAAAGAAEVAAAGGDSSPVTSGGDGTAGELASDEAHGEEAGGQVSGGGRRTPQTGAAVSFAVTDRTNSEAWSEGSADSAAGGDHSMAESGSAGQGENGIGGGKAPRGVRVRKKAVSVVVASAKHAVAIANSEGGVVIRARSASKKLLKSTSRFSTAPAAAADQVATVTAADSSAAAQSPDRSVAVDANDHQRQGGSPANQFTGGVGSEHMSAPHCHPAAATGGGSAAAAAAAPASIHLVPWDCMDDRAAWASQAQAAAGAHLVPGAPEAHQAAAAAAAVPAAAAKAGGEDRTPRQGAAGSRRVTGCDDGVTRVSRGGSVTPPLSRRSTREVGPGGSRSCTPPPNRGFSVVSTGNGAFSRYERGLADGLQQDFQVLPAESVTASRAPTPPATLHKPTTPQHRRTSEATSRPISASTQQPLSYEQQQQQQALQQQQQWQQGQDDHQQAAIQQDGQQGLQGASLRTTRQFIKGPSGSRGFFGELELSITSRQGATGPFNAAAAAAAASQACGGAAGDAEGCSGQFLKISSFRSKQETADSTGSSTSTCGMQDYAAAVAAYRAAGLADHAALGGLVLQADGSLLQLQAQQEQVVSRAEGWYRRLMKARGKAAGRQPWDQPVPPAGVGSSSSEILLGSAEPSGASGLGADSSGQVGPAGPWGRRSTVKDAWLYVDGRAAAALPWQALAAVAAAGQTQQDDTGAPVGLEWGLSGVSGGGGGGLSQMTVRGRRLLVRLMWLKSAAAVVRGQGKDAGFLEHRLVELLKVGTKPAGLDLLLWSVADEQQQAQQQAELRQQQQQQLLRLQEQLSGPSAWPEGGLGGVWRQQSSPEQALESFLHSQAAVRQKAATSSGALPASDFGKLHGDHLPMLPAARCAPLPGSRRTTQQQQQQQQQQLWLAASLEQQLQQQGQQLMVQQQQQEHHQQQLLLPAQHRQWHYSFIRDKAVLCGQQHSQADNHTLQPALLQQQVGSWQQVTAGSLPTQEAAAAAEPMVVSRKALMRRTTTDCKPLGSSLTLAGPWWKAVACDNAGPAHAHEQPRCFAQPLPGAAAVLQPQLNPPQRDTAGVACWQLGMQEVQAAGCHAAAAAAQQPTGLQALNTKGVSVTKGLMLAVSGEGNIATPVLRQHSSPQQLQQGQQPPQWQHQNQHQQQPLQATLGHPSSTPAQPHAQLWVIPELYRPQQQAMHPDNSQMLVSFVGSKPQQRRRPKQQQNDSTQQLAGGQVHQQGAQGLPCGTSLNGSKSGSLWGQQQLQGQYQGTAAAQQHSTGSWLPQLPGLPRAGQHGHPVSVASGVRQGQQAGALIARPVRLSSSDPGSTALLSAVAAVHAAQKPVSTGFSPSRAAAGVLSWQRVQGDQAAGTTAAEPPAAAGLASKPCQSQSGSGASAPRFGSHGGLGHVAVVEQQLPQLAALRVAGD